MSAVPTNLPDISTARLPATYEAACSALSECSRIDECQSWADKAEAMASYARQAKDDQLRKMADRIQARAIRRCGELLKQIEPATGEHRKSNGTVALSLLYQCPLCKEDFSAQVWHCPVCAHHWPMHRDYCANCHEPAGKPARNRTAKLVGSREQIANDAGLSQRQRETALRIASIPEESFNTQVEGESPPTVTQLAEQGKKRLVDLGDSPPADFTLATRALAQIKRFAEFAKETDAARVAAGIRPSEIVAARAHVHTIDSWLDQFITRVGD